MSPITRLEEDIKNLKVQGATSVALAVLDGINLGYEMLKNQKNADPYVFLLEHLIRLAFARPAEPLAQNALRFIFHKKQSSPEAYLQLASQFKKMITESKNKMGKYGSDLITNGGIYLTHCHSSTVSNMFISAHKMGKQFRIILTETRPLYQGRITANELIDAGIKDVTMIIDDVASSLLLQNKMKISGVLIGADLLSQDGFINKVGSLGIAYTANESHIPVYCSGILLKYDPRPYTNELLEQRNSSEIWPDAPLKLQFYTPAFDFVPYSQNIQIISEAGISKGHEIKNKAIKNYPFIWPSTLPQIN